MLSALNTFAQTGAVSHHEAMSRAPYLTRVPG